MADNWTLKGVSRGDDRLVPDGDAPLVFAGTAPRPRTSLLSLAVGVIALVALGATAWLYAETQREIKRVSTDIAQIRLSLELFGKQQAAAGTDTADGTADSSADDLLALSNRLALLEASQASAPPAPTSLPALPAGAAAAGGGAASGEDCLPVGTRFMMAAGDSYPVCGTTGVVAIAAVDNGYVTLSDGTIIAQGGTVGLNGTQCMLGVMPSEGDGLSGFAEVRVSC